MYGVIDIGSNTIRLVIYKVENEKLIPMLNKKKAVGLAGYISKDNLMKLSGMVVTIEALKEFEELLVHMNVKDVFAFATASIRNVDNSLEVLAFINKYTSFDVKILSGEEEAMFDYYGAIQSVDIDDGIMVDIGGGSTELVLYKNKEIVWSTSLHIGSLNLYNKFVNNIIPTKKEIGDIKKEVKKQLENMPTNKYKPQDMTICAVGGTARAVLKMITSKDKEGFIDYEYPSSKLKDISDFALADSIKLSKQVLKTSPDRIHTFIPGLVVLNTIVDYYKSDKIITSSYGVREGYLHYILEKRGVFGVD